VPVVTDDELGELTASFNEMLTELTRRADELRASRERIVAAADEERRRVERDLHDGAQQQLVLLRLKLGLLERDPSRRELLPEIRADVERAIAELRDLAHGLYPQALQSDGLAGALKEAVGRAPIPATLDCDGAGRYRPELEAAVYFCCLEALQNAAKHAGEDARAQLRLSERDRRLTFEVSDDGRGFDPATAPQSSGLQNMTDRIGALGGEVTVNSAPGAGTTIAGEVPLGIR
jgi:signal transduction histidine kinase